jgi:hypothetical protein
MRAAAARTEVDVGNPRRAIVIGAIDDHAPLLPAGKRAGKSSIVTFSRR